MLIRTVITTVILAASASSATAHPQVDPRLADEVFYHFMPIAWRDSDNDAYRFGDFNGMTASLDYLEDLGVTAVWMNPVFPSPAYHGYQHGPADEVNAWFGAEPEFLGFVQQAAARGIKVYVDLVCYGISHDSVYFQSAYGNPGSQYDPWLAFTNYWNTQYKGYTYSTWNGDSVGFIHWDLRTVDARNLVIQWSQHWLDPDGDGDPSDGLAGYRLDHVWEYYPDGPDGWGYNLDNFWIPWKNALLSVNPDVITFAEQADWGSHGTDLLPAHDATFTVPLMFAARDALSSESADRLYSEMDSTWLSLPDGDAMLAVLGNHDVDRIATVIGGSLEKAKAAAAVLLTQPFPPVIYFGDELGMLGQKETGYSGDAADIPMREPFKWNTVAGPPMSNYFVLNSAAYNNRYSRDNDGRSVEEQDGASGSLLEEYRLLIAARHDNAALRRGAYHAVAATSSRIWAFLRHHADQTVLVMINVRGSARSFNLDLSEFAITGGSTTPVDVVSGQTLPAITDANKAAYSASLPAYGYRILEVALTPPEPPANRTDGLDIPTDFGSLALAATQNNATGLGDNVSELNQLFARMLDDGLMIGVTGNLATDGTGLALLFDAATGGQNTLDFSNISPPPAGPDELTGLQLDAGFAPDTMLFTNAYDGTVWVDQFALPTGTSATQTYRGHGTVSDGDGFLSGGDNPNGMQVALDNSNTAGVTDTSADGAATATTGFELFIPWADLGLSAAPDEPLGLAAFLLTTAGDVSNQWLPGLGGGYDNLGVAPDMTVIPGDQHVFLEPPIAGDLDGDGCVDLVDLATLLATYGTCRGEPAYNATADLDMSGCVGLVDLAMLLANYGVGCG